MNVIRAFALVTGLDISSLFIFLLKIFLGGRRQKSHESGTINRDEEERMAFTDPSPERGGGRATSAALPRPDSRLLRVARATTIPENRNHGEGADTRSPGFDRTSSIHHAMTIYHGDERKGYSQESFHFSDGGARGHEDIEDVSEPPANRGHNDAHGLSTGQQPEQAIRLAYIVPSSLSRKGIEFKPFHATHASFNRLDYTESPVPGPGRNCRAFY
ncbi:hypothetical protein B0J14DRAFT_644343 [Halenospora varia]|nr:hypothetical protein B0J14DRAFT_644343 [Halenospora varia]